MGEGRDRGCIVENVDKNYQMKASFVQGVEM